MMKLYATLLLGLVSFLSFSDAFGTKAPWTLRPTTLISTTSTSSLGAATSAASEVETSVAQLKRVLEREYVSFFDPMRTEYYQSDVTFDDPMTKLQGVASYQNNVDMLASRTLLGSLLFQDAGINLHSIQGGEISPDGKTISDIETRWTLRVTAKILPWQPTARFTGISVYKVAPGGSEGVEITGQVDYWDSVNILPGGTYGKVDKGLAIQDFLNQLKPGGFQAQSAAPELPFELLRRGKGYEVRRYPSFSAVKMPYDRRDEGFGSLGVFTRGMNPLSPALMEVQNEEGSDKFMMWPLSFAPPGADAPPEPKDAIAKAGQGGQWGKCQVVTVPQKVVAVADFSDASVEPVVRKVDGELRQALKRDGLVVPADSESMVRFAQYDAIFSIGKRRGEVWIDLQDGGHPW